MGFWSRVRYRAVLMALWMALSAGACGEAEGLRRHVFSEEHMGTTVRLVLWSPSRAVADSAAAAAFQRVARLDSLFSDYRADSEVAALERAAGGEPIPVSPELQAVLVEARRWRDRTRGAFDVTVGPLTRLWRAAVRDGRLPETVALEEARARVDGAAVEVDAEAGTVRLARPGMALDLGGIAKGYAAGVVRELLAARGLEVVLVDMGGDLALGAPPPNAPGWRVEFPDGRTALLASVAVATSGDRYRYLEVDGVRYSHVVDPGSGLGVVDGPTVTVVAPDPLTADVLASALTVLSREEARRLVATLDGVSVRVAGRDGAWQTDDFPLPDPTASQEEEP